MKSAILDSAQTAAYNHFISIGIAPEEAILGAMLSTKTERTPEEQAIADKIHQKLIASRSAI